MIIKLRLDEGADQPLIASIMAMPKGERSARLKALLTLALAGTGGLLVRVETLERQMAELQKRSTTELSPTPLQPPAIHEHQAMHDLFAKAGAFED